MNRWWFHSDVWFVVLCSLASLPPTPSSSASVIPLSSLSPSDLAVWPLDKVWKKKKPLQTSNRLRYFLLFNPCVRLLLVRCQHLRALFYFNRRRKDVSHLVFGFETSSPLVSFPLMSISWKLLIFAWQHIVHYFKIPPCPFVWWYFCNHFCLPVKFPLATVLPKGFLTCSFHYSPKVLLRVEQVCPADHWWKHQFLLFAVFLFLEASTIACLSLSGNKDQNSFSVFLLDSITRLWGN